MLFCFVIQIKQPELSESTLVMQVYDFNRFSKHDIIGELRLQLSSVDWNHVIEEWKDLTEASKFEVTGLMICPASFSKSSQIKHQEMKVHIVQHFSSRWNAVNFWASFDLKVPYFTLDTWLMKESLVGTVWLCVSLVIKSEIHSCRLLIFRCVPNTFDDFLI